MSDDRCKISFTGTMTLSIMTFSIMTLSIKGLFAALSIKGLFVTLDITILYHYAEFCYADCLLSFIIIIMLNVIMPNVIV